MDIDKLIRCSTPTRLSLGFGSLMDIDKLILETGALPLELPFWFSDGY